MSSAGNDSLTAKEGDVEGITPFPRCFMVLGVDDEDGHETLMDIHYSDAEARAWIRDILGAGDLGSYIVVRAGNFRVRLVNCGQHNLSAEGGSDGRVVVVR
jgi:hypothetical protein